MTKTKESKVVEGRIPHPIDIHVGARIRMKRKSLGISQKELADAIRLTFQQVQKYESGSNRISASKLLEIAIALKTHVSFFLHGLSEDQPVEGFPEAETERLLQGFLMTTEGMELAAVFPKIRHAGHRRRLLEFVRSLAEDPEI